MVRSCRCRSLSDEKLNYGQVDDMAQIAKPVRKRIIKDIGLFLKVLGDLVNHSVHVTRIVHGQKGGCKGFYLLLCVSW